jgi:hypothetical protein
MEYANTDHEIYRQGAMFYQAIKRKLGHDPVSPEEVYEALNDEAKERIAKLKSQVFEGVFGWAYTLKGRSGEVCMLKRDDL